MEWLWASGHFKKILRNIIQRVESKVQFLLLFTWKPGSRLKDSKRHIMETHKSSPNNNKYYCCESSHAVAHACFENRTSRNCLPLLGLLWIEAESPFRQAEQVSTNMIGCEYCDKMRMVPCELAIHAKKNLHIDLLISEKWLLILSKISAHC